MREKIKGIINSAILQSCNNSNDRNYFCENATEAILAEMRKHPNDVLKFAAEMLKRLEVRKDLDSEGLKDGLEVLVQLGQQIKEIYK